MPNSKLSKSAAADRARLAELLRARGGAAAEVPDRAPVLSFAQERMWFFDQLVPRSAAYNIHAGVRLRGPLDFASLQRSAAHVVGRHQVLRSTFRADAGQPVVSLDADPIAVCHVDCSAAEEAEAALAAVAVADAAAPFDLSRGPLLRLTLVRLADREHALLVTMHHIVSDGWSLGLFLSELTHCYDAFSRGAAPSLTDVQLQYPAFAALQRAGLQGPAWQPQLAYWRAALDGARDAINLITDRPRPSRPSHAGASIRTELGPELIARVKELARAENATVFMVLFAAFNVVLARWSGDDDLVVGTPVSGRTAPGAETALGCFINTVLLRTDLSGAPTFRGLVARIRRHALDAFANGDVPFEKLVEELQPQRDPSRNPLYQVMFNQLTLGNAPLQAPAGMQIDWLPLPDEPAKLDLTLYAVGTGERVGLRLVYAAELFDAATMAEFLSQYVRLLEQASAMPDRGIHEYSLRTPGSAALLPDPSLPIPAPDVPLVWDAIAARAAAEPLRIALRDGARTCSYGELHERATAAARTLLAAGVAAQDVVALAESPSIEYIALLLGALRARGVILLLDPHLPEERRRLMLREAQARWLAATHAAAGARGDHAAAVPIVCDADAAQRNAGVELPGPPGGDDPAYVFFTSGTTGVPKAVVGVHKGLGHFVQWQRDSFGITSTDRVAQITGVSFDVILREFFLPLTSGATLCLRGSADLSGDRVLAWLAAEQITTLHAVPTLAHSWLAAAADHVIPSVRHTFFAGEPLPASVVRRWRELCPNTEVINLYGPTETTLAKCAYRVPPDPVDGIQPVGAAMPNAQAIVLNSARQQCGIGERGEVAIRTPFRTRGYRNAPDEQRKRFVANPFAAGTDDLLYLTGDQGRYRPDGLLELHGRMDDQVKIRGARIELSEVASVLWSSAHVSQAAVTVHGSGLDAVLVAYVVPAQAPLDVDALRAMLRTRLPEYMVPSIFMPLAAMPVTANGKIDKRKLPVPELAARTASAPFEPPATPVEETIASVWCELLKVPRVGALDNFFDLGGHSLLATQLTSRLRSTFGVDVPLRTVFDLPTVRGLSIATTEAMLTAEAAAEAAAADTIGGTR